MINIGIIEDESRMREFIGDYIEQAIKKFNEVKYQTYESAETFLESGIHCDILILDIDLPGINGISLGKILRGNGSETELLYLTSYPEYAAESYLIDAYQYILKVNMKQRLPEILNKLIDTKIKQKKEYRLVGIKGGKKRLFYKDIVYIQKIAKGGKYVEYVTMGDIYHERISMGQLMEELADLRFILLDRGHVVNVEYVERIEGNVIRLITGERFAVSRIRVSSAKKQIMTYLEKA